MDDHETITDFNQASAVSPDGFLYWDRHGLILETKTARTWRSRPYIRVGTCKNQNPDADAFSFDPQVDFIVIL